VTRHRHLPLATSILIAYPRYLSILRYEIIATLSWFRPRGEAEHAMTSFDPKLHVQVVDDEIIVTLLGTDYSVTYYKPENSPGLLAKRISNSDDPRIPMRVSEFLAKAWKAANERARELGWIV
jgi:hypothetical protein